MYVLPECVRPELYF